MEGKERGVNEMIMVMGRGERKLNIFQQFQPRSDGKRREKRGEGEENEGGERE